MSEFDQDRRVAGLLVAAADATAPHIRPRGVGAVVRTVRKRRTRKVAGVSALALLAVFAPLTVLGLTDRHAPDTPVGSRPPTSAAPSASVSPPAASPSGPAAPDGRLPASQLRNATLRIPAWPKGFSEDCPTGSVTFRDGRDKARDLDVLQGDPVYVDVDHDGAQETVVLVACSPQGTTYQVLALDRDAAGRIVTVGRIVGSAGNTGTQGSDIMTIWAVKAGANGQVRVDVGEYYPCCDALQASQHQWRTYGWNGKRFAQTGGPTEFGPNPKVTDLVVTADPLTMTRQENGSWTGTLRVRIHNAAAFRVPGQVQFALTVDATWRAQPGTECHFTPGESPLRCRLPSLAPGADRVLTIQLTAPPGPLGTRCEVGAYSVVDAYGHGYPDVKENGPTKVQVVEG